MSEGRHARLFDLEADPVHALEFLCGQVDDEARGEVVEDGRQLERRERRLVRQVPGWWWWWVLLRVRHARVVATRSSKVRE